MGKTKKRKGGEGGGGRRGGVGEVGWGDLKCRFMGVCTITFFGWWSFMLNIFARQKGWNTEPHCLLIPHSSDPTPPLLLHKVDFDLASSLLLFLLLSPSLPLSFVFGWCTCVNVRTINTFNSFRIRIIFF